MKPARERPVSQSENENENELTVKWKWDWRKNLDEIDQPEARMWVETSRRMEVGARPIQNKVVSQNESEEEDLKKTYSEVRSTTNSLWNPPKEEVKMRMRRILPENENGVGAKISEC
jgi:hypothetical protein